MEQNYFYGDAVVNMNNQKNIISVKDKNLLQSTDNPQIHLSCIDGITEEDATELIFHKMKDGKLFVEIYFKKEMEKYGMIHYQTDLDETARKKLIDFLNNPTTY